MRGGPTLETELRATKLRRLSIAAVAAAALAGCGGGGGGAAGTAGGGGGGGGGSTGGTGGALDPCRGFDALATPAPGTLKTCRFPKSFNVSGGPGYGIAVDPGGNVWFTLATLGSNENKVVRVSASGQITELKMPTPNSRVFAMASGPDGNMWMTESAAKQIARVTPGGKITEFALPAGSGNPGQIVSGSDGNLWFTEQLPDSISRITPAGVVTRMSLPSSVYRPKELTVGPDDNLWFMGESGAYGFMTAAGAVTVVGRAQGIKPRGLTTGPDGNLWFIQSTVLPENETPDHLYHWGIERLTPSGVVTEYVIGTDAYSFEIVDLVGGPDGRLWFTEELDVLVGGIGAISTDGQVTQYPVGLRSLSSITAGQGKLWFVGIGTSAIDPFNYVAYYQP